MDTLVKKAHFLRRASFGSTLAELNSSTSNTELLDKWLREQPIINTPNLGSVEKGIERRNQALKFSDWLVNQAIAAPNPLHEKITNFWRDHFVVSIKKIRFPQLLTDYETRLRKYALGDFRDLLWNVTTSPAMLSYLDNAQNRAGKINENYSREVMELFTIGRGQYSEKDIQEGARALTGWIIKPDRQMGIVESIFMPRRHDAGVKTYLGKKGNFKTEDIVDILANHPSIAKTIGHKLWSTFVYPNPESEIVDRLAMVYKNSDRSIKTVVEAVFTSPEFYSAKAYRSRLKTPIYFMIGTLRQLEIKADTVKVMGGLRSMGQVLYNAPTVKGWSDDSGWLTAPSLLTRLNLAQQMTQDYGDDGGFDFDPKNLTAKELVDLLLDGNAEPSLLSAFQGLSIRESAALILSSPTYQLA
ncbi:MAG: DUF1800 domain-containing protein [Pseudanabaena frigida]|uniref:DUF1800 domain-containing protein n=1 Tax=Pseudanabaena frigida TaxID=945775 RepID=A0A2W4Y4I4_9CYAN|nr:MAG: DUF1800 domain-containing protein [Pseudanabaena frigida]